MLASVGNALPIYCWFPLVGGEWGHPAAFPCPSRLALRHFTPPLEGVPKPSGSGRLHRSGKCLYIRGGVSVPKKGVLWKGIVGLVLWVGLLGCRTNPQVALLELENRLLEDRIYQLEAQLAKQTQQLAACRQQMGLPLPAESRAVIPSKEAAPSGSTPGSGSPTMSHPAPGPGISPSPPPFSGAEGKNTQNKELSSVHVHLPQQSLPAGQMPKIFSAPAAQSAAQPGGPNGPLLNIPAGSGNTPASSGPSPGPPSNTPPPEPANPPSSASGNPPGAAARFPSFGGSKEPEWPSSGSPATGNVSPEGQMPSSLSVGLSSAAVPGGPAALATTGWRVGEGSNRVQQIQIIPALTGPYNADGQPGDEGITVGLQPVDGRGGVVPAAAPISLVVIDPAIADDSARVARWDFSAEQIAGFTQNLPQGQPLRLVLVWPSGPPQHNRLHLFVRYVTADGRKLQADIPLQVDVAGRQIALLSGGGPAGQAALQPMNGPASSGPRQPPGGSSAGAGSAIFSQQDPSGGGSVSGGSAPFQASSPTEGIGSDGAAGPSPISPPATPIPESYGRRPRIPWQPTR